MKYVIEGEFTTLNEYIRIERSNKFMASQTKKDMTFYVSTLLRDADPIPERMYPVRISFTWYVKDKKTDADNIDFSKKFILDGMVKAGVLKDDNRRHVAGFGPCIVLVDKENPRVEVEIFYQFPSMKDGNTNKRSNK